MVLDKADAAALFVDPASGRVLARAPTGVGPHEAATSPDGRTVVVADYGAQEPGHTLTVLDVENARVVATIDLGEHRRPHGLAWLDDRRLVATVEQSRAVVEVDVPTRRITRVLPTEQDASHMLAVSDDGERLLTANIGSGSVTILDLVKGEKLGDVETGAGAEGLTLTPDGRHAWVTNRGADTVSVVDVASREVVAELPSPRFPIRAQATPDGRHVLVTNAVSAELVVFDARSHERVATIDLGDEATKPGTGSVPIGILVEPSGRRAYVARAGEGDIVVVDLRELAVVRSFDAGRQPDGMAWSGVRVARDEGGPRAAAPGRTGSPSFGR